MTENENGDDIVARLENLATKMFQSGNWGADLDTVKVVQKLDGEDQ
jgi:hypothetical protein